MEECAYVGGRPLGLIFGPDKTLFVAFGVFGLDTWPSNMGNWWMLMKMNIPVWSINRFRLAGPPAHLNASLKTRGPIVYVLKKRL